MPKWSSGHRPTFEDPSAKIDPYTTRKDTLTIPAGGYAIIQFLSDNPGYWFMHCHVVTHQTEGMAIIINEAPGHQKPGPETMPISGNFSWTLENFYDSITTTTRVFITSNGTDLQQKSPTSTNNDIPNSNRLPIISNLQHKPPITTYSDVHIHKLENSTRIHDANQCTDAGNPSAKQCHAY